MKIRSFLQCVALLFSCSNTLKALEPKVVSDLSIEAQENYWQSFEKYQQEKLRLAQSKYQTDLALEKQTQSTGKKNIDKAAEVKLAEAIALYESELKLSPDMAAKPYSLTNLASSLYLYYERIKEAKPGEAKTRLLQGLALCQKVREEYPEFDKIDHVMYVQALFFLAAKEQANAIKAWKRLASLNKNSPFVIYANLALGDENYLQENPERAGKFYEVALALTANSPEASPYVPLDEITYRCLWASYRAGQFAKLEQYALSLLKDGLYSTPVARKSQMQKDAIYLLADSLYEKNNSEEIANFIKTKAKQEDAVAMVAAHLMQSYLQTESYAKLAEIALLIENTLPLSPFTPEILSLRAKAHLNQKDYRPALATLDQIALLMPKDSLFRQKFAKNATATNALNQIGLEALELAAGLSFDLGLKSQNIQLITRSFQYYSDLVATFPNHKMLITWQIKKAHSAFYAGNFATAALEYDELLRLGRLGAKDQELIAYQLVLAEQEAYKKAFTLNLDNHGAKDPVSIEANLNRVEEATLQYLQKNPRSQHRGIDLLINVANFFEENKIYSRAEALWLKILASKPSTYQRSLALRGLTYTTIKNRTALQAAQTMRSILTLENFDKAPDLQNELLAVYSKTLKEAATTLQAEQQYLEAAALLCSAMTDFPKVPSGEKLYRDGVILLATEQDWPEVDAKIDLYFASGRKLYSKDLYYLQARSHENQFRFKKAASAFLDVALKHHFYEKYFVSLQKASELGRYEDDFTLAAKAEVAWAKATKNQSEAFVHLQNANAFFGKAGDFKSASDIAAKLISTSKNHEQMLYSKLSYALNIKDLGYQDEALLQLKGLFEQIKSHKDRLGEEIYSDLCGKTLLTISEVEERPLLLKINAISGSNVKEVLRAFDQVKSELWQASRLSHSELAAKARYRLSLLSATLLDQLQSHKEEIYDRLAQSETVHLDSVQQTLRNLKQELLNENLLEGYKQGQEAIHNIWIVKSSQKLGQKNIPFRNKTSIPQTASYPLPTKWSL